MYSRGFDRLRKEEKNAENFKYLFIGKHSFHNSYYGSLQMVQRFLTASQQKKTDPARFQNSVSTLCAMSLPAPLTKLFAIFVIIEYRPGKF